MSRSDFGPPGSRSQIFREGGRRIVPTLHGMRRSWGVSGTLVLALALGCDPATPATEAQPVELEPRESIGACLAECAEAQTLSPTDRATCRLICEAGDKAQDVSPSAIGEALTGRFFGCVEGCPPRDRATDRATCALNCAQQASSGEEAAHWSAGQRECAADCLTDVGACLRGPSPNLADCREPGQQCIARCGVPGVKEGGAGAPAPPAEPSVPPPPGLPAPPA